MPLRRETAYLTENVPYLVGKDGFYMQSTVVRTASTCILLSLCLLKHRSRSPGRRHDVALQFWASVIPELNYVYYMHQY